MAKPLLTDALWKRIEPLLPSHKPRRRFPGRKPIDDRKALTGILFVLKTGINWEERPQEMGCGCGMTCWRRLRDWNQAGVWQRLHETLLAELHEADRIDWARALPQFRGHHAYFFGVRCGVPETTRLPWVRGGKYRGVVLCGPSLADELDDRRNQLGRHDHDGLALGEKSGFVLRDLFGFGLIVVVLGKLASSLFIPSCGIRLSSSLGHFFFLRWRLRNARFASGVRSKAVTTNALSATLSGT